MVKYVLTYFPARGRAEAVRLAFAFGGIPFEDRRLAPGELFGGRDSGAIPCPYQQFPVLEVDGTPIAQSATQFRFVARAAGLYPADAVKAAVAESIAEQARDVLEPIVRAFYGPADAREAAYKAVRDCLPRQLKGLVAYLGDHPFFLGDAPTLADLAFFAAAQDAAAKGVDILEAAPELRRVVENVGKLPAIAAYVAARDAAEAAAAAAAAAK